MRIRCGLLLLVASACADGPTPPPKPVITGPAVVVIETATVSTTNDVQRVTAVVRNDGGDGSYFLEVASGTGATVRSEFVDALIGYRATVTFDVVSGNISEFGTATSLRIYSRAEGAAVSTRTDCYVFATASRC